MGREKRALTLPGPPTDGENEWEAGAANLAGATQPLGRRTIFLGHGQFVPIESHFFAIIPFSAKMSHSCRYFGRLHYVSLTAAERDACILEIVQRTSLEDGAPQRFA